MTTLRELDELAHELAYEGSVSVIGTSCVSNDCVWLDVDSAEHFGAPNVARALKYLEMRGLVEHDANNPSIISIRDESEATAPLAATPIVLSHDVLKQIWYGLTGVKGDKLLFHAVLQDFSIALQQFLAELDPEKLRAGEYRWDGVKWEGADGDL